MKDKINIEAVETVLAKAELLCSEREVNQALDDMAASISLKLQYRYPLCLSVMLGGLIPTGQLIPRLNFPLELDYIHATRYRDTTQGGTLQWKKQPTIELTERSILIIDDILDEGLTLKAIVDYCYHAGATEVLTAVLVEKIHDRRQGLPHADFTGLTVPDRYVFGCGMDYQGQLRYVPAIYAVHGL